MKPKSCRIHRIATIIDPAILVNSERFSGLLRYASTRKDMRIVVIKPDYLDDLVRNGFHDADGESFDGIIAGNCWKKDNRIPIRTRIPVVIMDPSPGWAPQNTNIVSVNDAELAKSAAELLIRRGNVNFAYVGTNMQGEYARSESRRLAFCQNVKRHGFGCQTYIPQDCKFHSPKDEVPILMRWLTALPLPCGILAYADDRARLVVEACHQAHIAIPNQVNIISVDNDIAICECVDPPLSSIWPDFERCGYLAAEIIDRKIRNPRSRPLHLKYGMKSLVERASTQDLHGGGRLVTAVSEYIRQHFRERILISDIAKHLKVSRRLLDIRFRQIRNTSIHDELERLRLSEACTLLGKTKLPVCEIARKCGYATDAAFRKAFTAKFRKSPLKFRSVRGK